MDFLAAPNEAEEPCYSRNTDANQFLQTLEMHGEAARIAIAKAQTKQLNPTIKEEG